MRIQIKSWPNAIKGGACPPGQIIQGRSAYDRSVICRNMFFSHHEPAGVSCFFIAMVFVAVLQVWCRPILEMISGSSENHVGGEKCHVL